jgi:hypothetical protein
MLSERNERGGMYLNNLMWDHRRRLLDNSVEPNESHIMELSRVGVPSHSLCSSPYGEGKETYHFVSHGNKSQELNYAKDTDFPGF